MFKYWLKICLSLLYTGCIILLFISCGGSKVERFTEHCRRKAIHGGIQVDFNSVVRIGNDKGYACSASIISPNALLTAKHCILEDQKAYIGGAQYDVIATHSHSDVDLAVLILDKNVPFPPFKLAEKLPDDGQVIMYGFGRVYWAVPTMKDLHAGINSIYTTDDTTFVIQGSPNLCYGDSGGPSLNLDCEIIGVHESILYGCGVYGRDVRVDVFRGWINGIIDEK